MTDAELKSMIITLLGDYATMLQWTDASPILDLIVDDVRLAFAVTDVTAITDIRALRATAQYYAFQAALAGVATLYDFSVDGRTFNRSQIVNNLKSLVSVWSKNPHVKLADALDTTNDYLITAIPLTFTHDPYAPRRSTNYRDRPKDVE